MAISNEYVIVAIAEDYPTEVKRVRVFTRNYLTGERDSYELPSNLPIEKNNLVIYGYDKHESRFNGRISARLLRTINKNKGEEVDK